MLQTRPGARAAHPWRPSAWRTCAVGEPQFPSRLIRSRKAASADRAHDAFAALAETLRLGGHSDEAARWYGMALQLNPRMPNAHTALGAIHAHVGQLDEAVVHFRRALEIDENATISRDIWRPALVGRAWLTRHRAEITGKRCAVFHGDLRTARCCSTSATGGDGDGAVLIELPRAWNARHAHSLAAQARPHENERSPERRLRIGYVSADFRTHVQALFTIPLLQNHDHRQFEIFCYSSTDAPDALTERIRAYADVFREVAALDDAALSELIRKDQIDILVDLTMHMTDRRLLAFARRPAPVQLCWLAYPRDDRTRNDGLSRVRSVSRSSRLEYRRLHGRPAASGVFLVLRPAHRSTRGELAARARGRANHFRLSEPLQKGE